MNAQPRRVVVGVGNEFRRDDGVGWAVVAGLSARQRRPALPAGVELLVSDGDPGRLMGAWEGAELCVVVDAAHAHPGEPGRVHRLEVASDELSTVKSTSSHGLGLGEAVELARTLDSLPRRLIVFAVEGQDTALGIGLSEPVGAAVQPLVERVAQEILDHHAAGELAAAAERTMRDG